MKKQARHLSEGDRLTAADGRTVTVVSVVWAARTGWVRVMFSEGTHTDLFGMEMVKCQSSDK